MPREPKTTTTSKRPLQAPARRTPRRASSGLLAQIKASVLPSDRRTKDHKAKIDRAEWMEDVRKRFEQGAEADRDQVQRELDDLRFYALDQWPDDVKTARAGQNATNGLPPVP